MRSSTTYGTHMRGGDQADTDQPQPQPQQLLHDSVAPDKYLVTDKFLDKVKETLENLRTGKEHPL